MRVGRVACVMVLAASAAGAQSRLCSSYGSLSDCEGQLCENEVQYCVWNVTAGSCGCPGSCSGYAGRHELCVNSACPSLLPQQHVPCKYNYNARKCWCPEAAETGVPATPAAPTSAPPTSAPLTPAPATYVPGTTLVPATEAPEPPLCNETTLVSNPSFENISTTTNIAEALRYGNMESWEVSHGHPTVMAGAPGQGLRSAWMWSHSGAGEGIVTDVPFVNGQTYRVSMWVTTRNAVHGRFFVKAVAGLVTQTAIYPFPSFTGSEEMYSNGMVFPDWDEISFNYTATDTYEQLWIYPRRTGGPPQAQVQVDNIRVCAVETDAPATPAPAPPTSAPPTSAPATPAPTTPAPATPAPPTSAPPTSAPPTSAPPTSAPATPAPTPWPMIFDDCSSFHGLPRTCMSSLCFVSGKGFCKYDFSSNLCLCA